MLDEEAQAVLNEVTWKDPRRVGGALCFRGTRVSVQTLADYLRNGRSLDYFLEGFPTVEREQAERFLDLSVRMADQLAIPEKESASEEQPA